MTAIDCKILQNGGNCLPDSCLWNSSVTCSGDISYFRIFPFIPSDSDPREGENLPNWDTDSIENLTEVLTGAMPGQMPLKSDIFLLATPSVVARMQAATCTITTDNIVWQGLSASYQQKMLCGRGHLHLSNKRCCVAASFIGRMLAPG